MLTDRTKEPSAILNSTATRRLLLGSEPFALDPAASSSSSFYYYYSILLYLPMEPPLSFLLCVHLATTSLSTVENPFSNSTWIVFSCLYKKKKKTKKNSDSIEVNINRIFEREREREILRRTKSRRVGPNSRRTKNGMENHSHGNGCGKIFQKQETLYSAA